jgi:hypothetical protein
MVISQVYVLLVLPTMDLILVQTYTLLIFVRKLLQVCILSDGKFIL